MPKKYIVVHTLAWILCLERPLISLASFDGLASWLAVSGLSHPYIERFSCNPYRYVLIERNIKVLMFYDFILFFVTKMPLCLIYFGVVTKRLIRKVSNIIFCVACVAFVYK